jgi:PAS domain S-box-containing protein
MSIENKKTILLVEDEAITSIVTSKTLKKFGYNVVTAETGEMAIETAKSNNNINLILMDIDLGKGIDGTEAAAIILKDHDIPVLFLSSHTEPEVVEKTEKITSYGYVVKNSGNTILDASIKMAFKLFDSKEKTRVKDEKYRFLVENLNDVIFTIDISGIITYVSPQVEQFSQYKVEEIIGRNFIEFVHPEDLPKLLKSLPLVLKGEKDPWEFRIIKKDSSVKYVRTSGNLIKKNGETIGLTTIMSDITESKQAEEDIRVSEKNFRLLFQNINSINSLYEVVRDKNGKPFDYRYLEVNLAFEKLVGMKASELTGRTLLEVFPQTEQYWMEEFEKVVTTSVPSRIEQYSKELNAYTELNIYSPQKGQLAMTSLDISERRLAEREIKIKNEDLTAAMEEMEASNEELSAMNQELIKTEEALRDLTSHHQALLFAIPDIVAEFDNNKVYTWLNPAGFEFYGEDALGKEAAYYFEGEQDTYSVVTPLFNGSEDVIYVESWQRRRDGEKRLLAWWCRVIKDGSGKVTGVISTARDITERSQAEEKLRRSEKELQKTQQITHIGSWYLDVATNQVEWTEELYRMYGFDPALPSPPYTEHQKLFTPESWELLSSSLANTSKTGIPYELELKTVKKNGGNGWMWVRGEAVNDQGGKTIGLWGAAQDITERKKMEAALLDSEQRYKNFIMHTSEGIYRVEIVPPVPINLPRVEIIDWINKFAVVAEVNEAFSGMYGLIPADMIGKPATDFAPDYGKRAALVLDSPNHQVSQEETLDIDKDGNPVWLVESFHGEIDNGLFTRIWGVQHNITERKQSEEDLKANQRLLADIIDFLPDATLAIDKEKRVIIWNRAIEKMTGIPAADMIGKGDYAYTVPFYGKARKQLMDLAFEDQEEIKALYPAVRHEGGSIVAEAFCNALYNNKGAWVYAKVSPLHDQSGSIIGAIESIRDITEHKQDEDNIKNLLAEKELILCEVHHRIKNNMNVIHGLLVLQTDKMKDPMAISALEDSANRVQSMMVLYDKLYRSPDVQKISVMNYLPSLVDEIIANFPNSKLVKVEKKINDFVLDAKRLHPLGIIINELLTNIMKSAFIGRDDGLIKVSASLKGKNVSIIIQDNGIGIPETVDFEHSTGFGLQLVWILTKELQGTIRIERKKGTKIILEFKL